MTTKEMFNQRKMELQAILDRAKMDRRELTPLEVTRSGHIQADIAELQKAAGKEDAGEAFNGMRRESANDAALQGAIGNGLGFTSKAEAEANGGGASEAKRHRDLFNNWLRTGDRQLFTITSASDSSALIPNSVAVPTIVRRQFNVFLMALALTGYSVINNGTTDTLTIPVFDDSAVSGDTPAEDATTDTEADPGMASVSLGNTLYSSKSMWLSNTVVEANSFDILSYCLPMLDKRLSLSQDAAWTTALTALNTSGNRIVTAAANAVTYDELVEFFHKLSVPYRSDSIFIVSDALLQAMEVMKDSQGRPILVNDPQVSGVRTFFGRPVLVGANMPTIAANAIAGAFVSGEAIKVKVSPQRLAKYTNVPTFPDQLGLRLFQNGDAKFVASGCAFLKLGAS